MICRPCGTNCAPRLCPIKIEGGGTCSDLAFCDGAGEGNRTLMTSLEGWRSAIELRPRARREPLDGPPGWHRQRTGYGHPCVAASPAFRPWRGARSREPIRAPRDGRLRSVLTGCGAAWLARLLWEQEAPGSNPGIPTRSGFGVQPGQRARRFAPPLAGEAALVVPGPARRHGVWRGQRGHQPGTCLR
jgi:hypothetical protein